MKYTREYQGVTVTAKNYRSILEGPGGRDELRFHAKHLRAYLRGKDSFFHGWILNEKGEKSRPSEHQVRQVIILRYLTDDESNGFAQFSSQKELNGYLKAKEEEKKNGKSGGKA